MEWTKGTAIIATGSPFAPVEYGGQKYPIAQCNNSYIFPAMGLGVLASGANRVTDEMFMSAAVALKEFSPVLKDPQGELLPSLKDLRKLARHIAIAVGTKAQQQGLAPQTSSDELAAAVDRKMWKPVYPIFTKADP